MGRETKDITKPERGKKVMSEQEDKNPAVTKAIDETFAENTLLKAQVAKLEADLAEALEKLRYANDYIANQKRGDVITEVKKHYTVDDIYIQSKTTEELKEMVAMAEIVKPKVFKSPASIDTISDDLEKARYKLDHKFKF